MFFKKEETKNNNFLTKVCALLIHAAKIDENYTDKEEEIIKRTLNELGICLLYTSPSPRDKRQSRMPSSA